MVPGGGSVQLGKLIDEHGQAVLYDLRAHCGIDLRDLWRDGSDLTPRYVLWLVGQLPPESALWASQRGGSQWRPWPIGNQLLAAQVNHLAAANSQRAGKKPKPVITMPKESKPKGRVVTVAEIKARQQKK